MKKLFEKIKYEALLFAAMSFSLFTLAFKKVLVDDILYPLFLVDIKIGFTSRTLIGTLVGLIWEHPTKANAAVFQCGGLIFGFLLFSLFLGRCIRQAPPENRRPLLFIAALAAVLPLGAPHFVNLFELLDIYWLISALICVFMAKGKVSRYFAPLFIVLGLWVHYSFLFAFMPLIYIVYFALCCKEKNKNAYIPAALMVIVSVSFTLYFMLNARNLHSMSYFQFERCLQAKAGDALTRLDAYIAPTFQPAEWVNNHFELFNPDSSVSTVERMLLGNMKFVLRQNTPLEIIADLIITAPLLAFFSALWLRLIKSEREKPLRFLWLLCLISPLVQLFSLLLSTDTSRWCSHLLLSQTIILFSLLAYKMTGLTEALSALTARFYRYRTLILALAGAYCCLIFVW